MKESELLYKGNESVPLAKWRDYTFPIEFGFEVRTGSNQLENWVRSNYFWADPEAEDSITYVICYEDSAVQRNDATKSIAPNLPKKPIEWDHQPALFTFPLEVARSKSVPGELYQLCNLLADPKRMAGGTFVYATPTPMSRLREKYMRLPNGTWVFAGTISKK